MAPERQKELARIRGRSHYWRNRAKRLVQMKRWRDSHREYRAAKMRIYQRDHREEIAAVARMRARKRRHFLPPRPRKRRARMSREERLAHERLYRAANRDRLLAYRRARYHVNREKELARGRSYRERNRASLRARGRARYWREHEQSLAWSRRSYYRHRDKRRAGAKRYRNNPVYRPGRLATKRRRYWKNRQRIIRTPEWRRARARRKARTWHRYQVKHLTAHYGRRLLCKGTNLRPEDFSLEIVRLARAKLRALRAARKPKEEVKAK